MSSLALLARMAKTRLAQATAPRPIAPQRTPAPLNLTQGAVVEISPVPFILAGAAGARLEAVAEKQIVAAVGQLELFGLTVFRSYLDDGKSFIQTVPDKTAPHGLSECRLYSRYMEDCPADADAWAFYLAEEDGYIGYPMFDIKDGTRYWRLWSPGDGRIEPVIASETIRDAAGGMVPVQHRLMQYGRRLGDSDDAISEYLLVAAVETADAATFDAWLGLDLDPTLIKAVG